MNGPNRPWPSTPRWSSIFWIIDTRLADDLESRVDQAVELLLQHPQSAAAYLSATRRKLLGRFPYAIVYRFEDETKILRVVAFAHQHREPGYWMNR